jgi:hypothetical protein
MVWPRGWICPEDLIDAEDRTYPHARLKPSVNLASQGPRVV